MMRGGPGVEAVVMVGERDKEFRASANEAAGDLKEFPSLHLDDSLFYAHAFLVVILHPHTQMNEMVSHLLRSTRVRLRTMKHSS